jgi:hypothetical protein
MSVVECKEEIEQVCDALLCNQYGQGQFSRAVFNHAAAAEIIIYGKQPTQDEIRSMIWNWCNRVYMANQCAYILTYSHHPECSTKINFIGDENTFHKGGDLLANLRRFHGTLQHIRYNLYSNGGRYILCHEDMDRLDTLIEWVASAALETPSQIIMGEVP